jgi:hypothetical protein
MVFFVLNRKSVSIYSKRTAPSPLVFPESIVKHQEIQDHKQYEKLLADYLAHFPRNQIVIFLSPEIVFQKTLPQSSGTDMSTEEEKFVASIPFHRDEIQKLVIYKKSEINFFAINSDMYKSMVKILEQQGSQVRHVLPLGLFSNLLQGNAVSFETLSRLMKEKELIQSGDFWGARQDESKKENEGKKASKKQVIMLVFSVIFLLLALLVALKQFDLLPLTQQKALTKQIPTPSFTIKSPTPTATPQPTMSISALTVHVLNGSGIAGQATTVKEELAALGLRNIVTDNASSASATTTIEFANKVSKAVKDSIINELKKTFITIDEKVSSSSAFDIIITTGSGIK